MVGSSLFSILLPRICHAGHQSVLFLVSIVFSVNLYLLKKMILLFKFYIELFIVWKKEMHAV